MSKPKVVYWNSIPSPYHVERLNTLSDRGNIAIEGWFNQRHAEDRSWNVEERLWRFGARYIPSQQWQEEISLTIARTPACQACASGLFDS